jgi:hypothetical protein
MLRPIQNLVKRATRPISKWQTNKIAPALEIQEVAVLVAVKHRPQLEIQLGAHCSFRHRLASALGSSEWLRKQPLVATSLARADARNRSQIGNSLRNTQKGE